MPTVSVIVPVYNGGAYLSESVESILGQTFDDLELLIIDDGSQDSSASIVKSYSDPRIRLLQNEKNMGLEYSLNLGMKEARGRYFARMDSDDSSLPERLEKEVEVLERDRGIVLVGTAYHVVDSGGRKLRTETPPLTDTEIRWQLLFDNSFAHSSVMFRGDLVRSKDLEYSTEAYRAEDYELWSRILEFGKGINLPIPLIKYRLHDDQVSAQATQAQMESAKRISMVNIEKLGFNTTEAMESLRSWYHVRPRTLSERDMELFKLLFTIISRFQQINGIDPVHSKAIRRQWVLRAFRAAISGNFLRPATVRFLINIIFRKY